MTLVGLAGLSGSGKDTVAEVLVDRFGFERLAFADAIKEALLLTDPEVETDLSVSTLVQTYGWEKAKDRFPELRRLLQALGSSIREIDGEFWINVVMGQVWPGGNYVITDVRMPEEVEAILDHGGTVFRVERFGAGLKDGNAAHITEVALANRDFPVIPNHGTREDLVEHVEGRFPGSDHGEPPC